MLIMILRIAIFSVLAALISNNISDASDLWDIEVSLETVLNVPFLDGHVPVFKHKADQRYFIAPLAILREESAHAHYDPVNKQNEMRFDVEMFSDEARDIVFETLKNKNPDTKPKDIGVLPTEKVRLVWANDNEESNTDITLGSYWVSNSGLRNVIRFKFTCVTFEICKELEVIMKEYPEDFYDLQLDFVVNGQKSVNKKLTITGELISKGDLWTNMENQVGSDSEVCYLNSNDMKKLSLETASNLIVESTVDVGYVDKDDELAVTKAIDAILKKQQVDTENFTPQQWESVFWDPLNARPDKIASELNQIFTRNAGDDSLFTITEHSEADSFGFNIGAMFDVIGGEVGGENSHEETDTVEIDQVRKYLRDHYENIAWDGEKFVAKPVNLTRINLSELKSTQVITTTSVQVQKFHNVYPKEIIIDDKKDKIEPHQASVINAIQVKLDSLVEYTIPNLETKLVSDLESYINKTAPQLDALQRNMDAVIAISGGTHVCYLNNDEEHRCPKGFGRSTMNFYGNLKNDVVFDTGRSITNNLYVLFRERKEFYFCCREN